MVVAKGYKKTEIGIIPEDWQCLPLVDCVNYIHGKAHEQHVQEFGKYVVVNSKFISTEGSIRKFSNTSFCTAKIGDVLTVLSDLPNGKALAKCFLVNQNDTYAVNQRVCIWRPKSNSTSEYLFYVLNRNKYFLSLNDGVSQTHILNHHIEKCRIQLPASLKEQNDIASALSDMDELIAKTEKLIVKKKAIKQGVMQELLSPKEGWVTKKLGESSLILRGGSPRPIEHYLTNSPDGLNWIKIGDVEKNAKYITTTEEKINSDGASRSRIVNPGDFILSNSMSFGRPYILKISGCIHDGWLVISKYESSFDKDFLYYVLGSEAVYNQYKSMASGSSVLNLNKEIVKEVKVQCPNTIDEQKNIATVLSDIDDEISLIETKLQKLKLQKQGMMQVLLTGKIRFV
jgi:type I restriction enzyme S subunit